MKSGARPVRCRGLGLPMAGVEIRFDPAFVEETVFLELRAREAAGDRAAPQAFREEWDALYGVEDHGALRTEGFQRIAVRYFEALGFSELFIGRFKEFPLLETHIPLAIVRRVWSRKEERVELYVGKASGSRGATGAITTLSIGLQAARCLDRDRLVAFLRHEFLHISDMLEPAFAYVPLSELGGECEMEDDLIRDRFRLLWDLWVDGRMRWEGWQGVVDGAARRDQFELAFASWDPRRREAVFAKLSGRDQCTQRELLALANDERLTRTLGQGGVRCPLCHFPTREGVRDWSHERAAVAEAIRADYPTWEPSHGACLQCVELYRSRLQLA